MFRSVYIVFCLLVGLSACTHRFDGVEDNTPVGNFEMLWRTIDEKYCYLDDKEVNWQMVHDTILPRVKQIDSGDYLTLFDCLAGMLDVLEDGHVNLYSDFDVSRCESWYAGYPENFDWDLLEDCYLSSYRRAGEAYYTTVASGEIGYVYCPSFENPVTPNNMAYILRSFRECKGMIVDVRQNGGGSLEYAEQLAATFFSETRVVGSWQHKSGPGHSDFSPLRVRKIDKDDMPSKWLRPVVVLCNRHTYSAANYFVSAMRYADNSCILGGWSGGGGGIPMSYELPNGWVVRFSSIRMVDKEGVSIEGGVKPHLFVNQRSEDCDDLIESAVALILKAYETK